MDCDVCSNKYSMATIQVRFCYTVETNITTGLVKKEYNSK